MPKHINSASRLSSIVRSFASFNGKKPSMDVWVQIFSIEITEQHHRVIAVAEKLILLQYEVDIVRRQMASANFSEALYTNSLSNIQNAISPMLFAHPWDAIKQQINNETITAIEFCSEIIPDEESQITSEVLVELTNALDDLESLLANSDLPEIITDTIKKYVSSIRAALLDYQISGIKALKKVTRESIADIAEIRDELKSRKDSPVIGKFATLWRRVNTIADSAIKADKLLQLGHKAWEQLESYW